MNSMQMRKGRNYDDDGFHPPKFVHIFISFLFKTKKVVANIFYFICTVSVIGGIIMYIDSFLISYIEVFIVKRDTTVYIYSPWILYM